MKKVIIYGTGNYYRENQYKLPEDIEIVAYADSNEEKATSFSGKTMDGKKFITPGEIEKENFDLLYICTDYANGNRIFQNLKNVNMDLKKVRFLNRIDVLEDAWEYEIQGDKSILSKIGNIKIREKFLTDSDIVYDIFARHAYDFHIPAGEKVVVDIGMNVGIASLFFASKGDVAAVYGFEPFPDAYRQALDNFALNDAGIRNKIHPYNQAVSDKEETRTVFVNSDQTGWRSIFCEDDTKETVQICCKRASDVIGKIVEENKGRKIVVKIDTEGAEFPIFESLGKTELLKSVDAMLIEYHGEPSPIMEILDRFGFQYVITGSRCFGMLYAFC